MASTELQAIVRFRFHDGAVEEFKRLSAQCMEIVRARDTHHRYSSFNPASRITRCALRPALPLDLGPPTLFLCAQLRRDLVAEVLRLEHRANFDFGAAVERRALEPLNRVLH